ncbi:MAG: hypothetical protein KC449_29225 [Anaerolineales bacterium]|nr:hypothetical protein [Anaerolineales bacterium]
MEYRIQVGKQGTIMLPSKLCQKYNILTGETFHLTDLDGVFILSPIAPKVHKLAQEIEQMRQQAGLTTQELLTGLQEQREIYYTEKQTQ